MPLDVLQIGTNFLVAVGSAWLGAWFGARHAMETARRSKAFDQRLEWHLRTIRAMKKFQFGMAEYLDIAKNDRNAAIPIAARVEPMMMEFLMCTNEAALFTDRKTLLQLRDGAGEFIRALSNARKAMEHGEEWAKILTQTASINKIVESLDLELTRKLRAELRLDKLRAGDLQT